MSEMVTLSQVSKCLLTIARPSAVVLNTKARVPAYLLSLELSSDLLEEHNKLYKKKVYSSSAQITNKHTIEELENSLILTCINFPRKQIGPKMSDCLTCGVLPFGPDVDPQFKRDNTIVVRPFLEALDEKLSSDSARWVGAPVGVLPVFDEKRTTNPRDLSFEEFEKCQILLGTIIGDLTQTRTLQDNGVGIMDPEEGEHIAQDASVACDGEIDFGASHGIMKSRIWLRSGSMKSGSLLDKLNGRQVVAITNVDHTSSAELFESGMAAVLTMNGYTTVEPAKVADNGYKLA